MRHDKKKPASIRPGEQFHNGDHWWTLVRHDHHERHGQILEWWVVATNDLGHEHFVCLYDVDGCDDGDGYRVRFPPVAMRYVTRDEYQQMLRRDSAGPAAGLLPQTRKRWSAPYWSLQLEDAGTCLVPTTVCEEITVPRTELRAGDLWWVHDGWHRVISNNNDQPGNRESQRRTCTRIQAISLADGARAWGTREWNTGLRSDLATKDMCTVRRPLA